jgi:hypothetical protein
MLEISFSLNSYAGILSGFELGNVELKVDNSKIITSKGRKPDQSMMIFVTIINLLDGLRQLIFFKELTDFKLIGADSSFTIHFMKHKDKIKLVVFEEELCDVELNELVHQVVSSCKNFVERNKSKMLDSDPVLDDINQSLRQFRKLPLLGDTSIG